EVKIGEVVAVIEEGSSSAAKPAEPTASKGEVKSPPTGGEQDVPKQVPPVESSDALSPAVRRIVTEEKLDPQEIRGSGKGGRVTKGDALTAAQKREAEEKPAP